MTSARISNNKSKTDDRCDFLSTEKVKAGMETSRGVGFQSLPSCSLNFHKKRMQRKLAFASYSSVGRGSSRNISWLGRRCFGKKKNQSSLFRLSKQHTLYCCTNNSTNDNNNDQNPVTSSTNGVEPTVVVDPVTKEEWFEVNRFPFLGDKAPKERYRRIRKRTDLKKILVIGAGPIVIGQACEFDYSGTQACKALKAEGFQVVLVNSNPATIMTDPETADRIYIEPLVPEVLTKIIEKERPQAILPTMGGQTALNLAFTLSKTGVLDRFNVELIGARLDAIEKGEDRRLFKEAMERIGLQTCPSGIANSLEEAKQVAEKIGKFPLIIRPAYTLGGTGGGIAYNQEEYEEMAKVGLDASPTRQILVDLSLIGWKEYELEVMRDGVDNVVIVCGIENVDPMGVHTGDSITVAPCQTLTDREYQRLRDYAIAIIREIGVDTGGSNIQFAVNPENGQVIVVEMNPRVSRSSALASKATGFPIAKIAAKLAIGLSLPEIPNDITKKTPASFEPSLDYVVTKIPRFAFEKFPGASNVLTTQMRSVGEAMAMGRSFCESFQKAIRSLEVSGRWGFGCDGKDETILSRVELESALRTPTPERIFAVRQAFRAGMTIDEIYQLSRYDRWFLYQLYEIYQTELSIRNRPLESISAEELFAIKAKGFSDYQIAFATNTTEEKVRLYRKSLYMKPVYKTVDTCAGEFESFTPYLYSTYESRVVWGTAEEIAAGMESEVPVSSGKKKVLILGGGPNRIGQGIEFDYCCVHACFALQQENYETIMMNSNPETVSTDYDTSNRLYFEPLTLEDVIHVVEAEKVDGIVVQFGGQTPLKLAMPLQRYLTSTEAKESGVKATILGTNPESIDIAEDRDRFVQILNELRIRQPANGIARSLEEAERIASEIGYPVVVRPSYVLGGRGMEIVYNAQQLAKYMNASVIVESEHPVLIDRFLDNAIEVDVDALADKTGQVVIGGIMEHIEQAGIHSGDSACILPTQTIPYSALVTIRQWTVALAKRLQVVGLMNIQWAVQGDKVFILEANPRASRTVPFVSKAIGVPLAKIASLLMIGKTLKEIGFTSEVIPKHAAVKEAVLPFNKFPSSDMLLSPEMRSTGEVMGIDFSYPAAFVKAQMAAGTPLPLEGTILLSLAEEDKKQAVVLAQDFIDLGFRILATRGTYVHLIAEGMNPSQVEMAFQIGEGRPNIVDRIKNREIQLFIMTPGIDKDTANEKQVRRTSVEFKVPMITTLAAAKVAAQGIRILKSQEPSVICMQDYHAERVVPRGLATSISS